MTNITEVECAWTAGIIDGEGCLYIRRQKASKGAKNNCYSLNVRVAMTHMPTIQKLKNLWGGYYSERLRKEDNYKNIAIWELSSENAGILLTKIINYLVTKREEAVVALEFLSLPKAISFKETPLWLLNKRQELFEKIRQLKRYEYTVTHKKEIKLLKKGKVADCPVCGKKMSKYNDNGILKVVCSKECRFSKRRILTDEQEKELFRLYKEEKYQYKDLVKKFNIKRGSVGWILNKFRGVDKSNSLS